jgi:hypothetical protein
VAQLTYVYRRRDKGVRLSTAEMLARGPAVGILKVGRMIMGPPVIVCRLFDPADPAAEAFDFSGRHWPREAITGMKHATLARERDQVRLYTGVDDEMGAWLHQAWLCAPSAEVAEKILLNSGEARASPI